MGASSQSEFDASNAFIDKVGSWDDLSHLVDHFSRYNGVSWLFRGATDSTYELVPKVGRPRKKMLPKKKEVPYSFTAERAVLDAFKQQARPYVTTQHTPLEWLAIAQHFGAPTRLLDWSDSVLIAAWFAVQPPEKAGRDAAIWVSRNNLPIDPDFAGDPLELEAPYVYRAPHIAARIGAQGSVLMICPEPTKPAEPSPFLKKITIPGKARDLLRKRLNACGINARTVFCDLGGLGDHLAWLYQNNWLPNQRDSPISVLVDPRYASVLHRG